MGIIIFILIVIAAFAIFGVLGWVFKGFGCIFAFLMEGIWTILRMFWWVFLVFFLLLMIGV